MTVEAMLASGVGASVVGLGRGARGGSGVVVADGRVLTLAHHLRGDEVEVAFAGGRTAVSRAVATDAALDLALVTVDTDTTPSVRFAAPGGVELGSRVHALADPGASGLRVTTGAIAGAPRQVRGRDGRLVDGLLEHTAPLPRGSGGGPLVDGDGVVLGLNALRQAGGFILALPSAAVSARLGALLEGTAGHRPRRLGVAILPPRSARRLRRAVGLEERDGLLVRGTVDATPAERAGLRRGDLIVGAGGAPVATIDDLFAAVDAVGEGERLALRILRGGAELELPVTFDATPGAGAAS